MAESINYTGVIALTQGVVNTPLYRYSNTPIHFSGQCQ